MAQKRKLFRRHEKKNLVENALKNPSSERSVSVRATFDFAGLKKILTTKYKFTNITPIVSQVYNIFLTADIRAARNTQKSRAFIKTGRHAGIYKNEFVMGLQLYNADPRHFLKPLCYNDDGKYNFVATEYADGETLESAIEHDKLTTRDRANIIEDIYHIFLALKSSDVVHRDIRPANIMILENGRTVLIDFQLAVSKSNYVELDYCCRRPQILRNLGGHNFRYKPFVWDDAYSLMRIVEFIGRDESYGALYDTVHSRIKSYVGRAIIKSAVRESGIARIARHARKTRQSIRILPPQAK